MRRIESLLIAGPAGNLEALVEEPESGAPREAALVCHPHPLFGGTMHNKVVHRLARGLRKSGCVVLRFNFRGVNLSQGQHDEGDGEVEDARVALEFLRSRYPHMPCTLAGFSFGSRIALRLAGRLWAPIPRRVIAAGFPTTYAGREFVATITLPRIFVQSTHDEFGPRSEMEPWVASLPGPREIHWIEAKDHFFTGALEAFERVVQSFG